MESYIEVNGHPTWVSDTQTNKPAVLLLHGGLVSSETTWPGISERLAEQFRVVMFDRRGHGRTADTNEPFHYGTMADEAAGVIEALSLAPVHAVGYSDGANLLLHLALARPQLLRSMVLISGNYHHDALLPEAGELLRQVVSNPRLRDGYGARSPDGVGHWPTVVAKGLKMGVDEEPTFSARDLAPIRVPTLVMAGDDDMVAVSHSASMYETLAEAQLAIVPGTSHALLAEKPALMTELIASFLSSPGRPATVLGIRRRSPRRTTGG